jgi:hypothetical protein
MISIYVQRFVFPSLKRRIHLICVNPGNLWPGTVFTILNISFATIWLLAAEKDEFHLICVNPDNLWIKTFFH